MAGLERRPVQRSARPRGRPTPARAATTTCTRHPCNPDATLWISDQPGCILGRPESAEPREGKEREGKKSPVLVGQSNGWSYFFQIRNQLTSCLTNGLFRQNIPAGPLTGTCTALKSLVRSISSISPGFDHMFYSWTSLAPMLIQRSLCGGSHCPSAPSRLIAKLAHRTPS